MQKSEVIQHFGTQIAATRFMREKTGKDYAHTTIAMWNNKIPVQWALFFDKHTDLIFKKDDYC